jgi:hypothetical protein
MLAHTPIKENAMMMMAMIIIVAADEDFLPAAGTGFWGAREVGVTAGATGAPQLGQTFPSPVSFALQYSHVRCLAIQLFLLTYRIPIHNKHNSPKINPPVTQSPRKELQVSRT